MGTSRISKCSTREHFSNLDITKISINNKICDLLNIRQTLSHLEMNQTMAQDLEKVITKTQHRPLKCNTQHQELMSSRHNNSNMAPFRIHIMGNRDSNSGTNPTEYQTVTVGQHTTRYREGRALTMIALYLPPLPPGAGPDQQ